MNRIAAILFLSLMIFNAGGYRLYFNHLESAATKKLIHQLDNNLYSDDELIEIKIPMRLTYNISWTSFERIDGEIEWNGKNYNYVKRKFQNDSLFILCIPSNEKATLAQAKNQFFSIINDLQHESGNQRSDAPLKIMKLITAEYISNTCYKIPSLFSLNISVNFDVSNYRLLAGFINCTYQPPDSFC